jgi:hypothetical protein
MPESPPASPARWFFVPEFYTAGWSEACELLAAAPKPLIVAPLPEPGFVGTWHVGALAGVHRTRADHQLANQQAFFAAQLEHLHLEDSDRVGFDSGPDHTVFAVADFKRWLREYAVCAGSTLQAHNSDPRMASLLVRKPHGGWSPGAACRRPDAAG